MDGGNREVDQIAKNDPEAEGESQEVSYESTQAV
jgi:hypothetical protein